MKRNSPLLIIAIVVGVSFVVILFLWFTLWSPPSKQDYANAVRFSKALQQSYNKIATTSAAYNQAEVAAIRIGKNDNALKQDTNVQKAAYDEAIKQHDEQLKKLSDSKAIRDPELKKAYASAAKHDKDFKQFFTGMVATYGTFYHSYISCDDIFTFDRSTDDLKKDADTYRSISADCKRDLETLKKSANAVLRKYGQDFGAIVSKRQAIFDSWAKTGTISAASLNEFTELSVQNKKLTPISDLQAARKAVLETTELNSLSKLLESKQRA